ncbi:hypothetical protein FPQ18DRAFT_358673 [Pyronema domesticum]|nr:hypothetical protein FPQ18DRAFT_358673 [Pyronema domesticum]
MFVSFQHEADNVPVDRSPSAPAHELGGLGRLSPRSGNAQRSQPNSAPMAEKPGTVSNATCPVQYIYAPHTAAELIAMSADELEKLVVLQLIDRVKYCLAAINAEETGPWLTLGWGESKGESEIQEENSEEYDDEYDPSYQYYEQEEEEQGMPDFECEEDMHR